MNSLSASLFRPSDHAADQTLQDSSALKFHADKGLYTDALPTKKGLAARFTSIFVTSSGSSPCELSFPSQEQQDAIKAAYGRIMERINQQYGPDAAAAFHDQFRTQRKAEKPLTLGDVNVFLHGFLRTVDNPGIILNSPKLVEEIFKQGISQSSPEASIIFTSRETITRSGAKLFVSEDFKDCQLPKAYAHILGAEERQALVDGLKKRQDFREGGILPTDSLKKSSSASSLASETSSESVSTVSDSDIETLDRFEKHAESLALGSIMRGDWDRFELIIGDKKVALTPSAARTTAGAEAGLSTFKSALQEIAGRDINNREAFEILRLITNEGRTGGFPAGTSSQTGIGFNTDVMDLGKPNPEKVTITFNDVSKIYKIAYTPAQCYLKGIIKTERDERSGLEIPQSLRFDVAAREDGDSFTFSETQKNCPQNVQRFETISSYTYELTPPASVKEEGSFNIIDSRHGYWPV